MTLTMPCTACGFVVSATSLHALTAGYFEHCEAAHPPTPRPVNVLRDAFARLVKQ